MWAYLWQHPAVTGVPMVIAICGLAMFKGGPAERYAGAIFMSVYLLTTALDKIWHSVGLISMIVLASDAVTAATLLWLAMRYRKLWLATAMIVQGTAFIFHVILQEQPGEIDRLTYLIFVLGINFSTLIVLFLILFGTIGAWRKRAKAQRTANNSTPNSRAIGAAG